MRWSWCGLGDFYYVMGWLRCAKQLFLCCFFCLWSPSDVLLDLAIHAFRESSTEVTYLIFEAVGTPVSRNGFLLSVPGVTIEIANECSSIHSSIALVVTCSLSRVICTFGRARKWLCWSYRAFLCPSSRMGYESRR